jgi:hypothetical protein
MNGSTLVGIFGTAIILIAFVLNQIQYWDEKDLLYDIANAIGSILLGFYAWHLSSYPFVVLNAVWAAVSVRDITRILWKKH